MTLGRNAVGYLTESMHGAGSPQAQRVQIARAMQVEFKKQLAKSLAGIAASQQAARTASGVDLSDDMLSNVCKHHVTRLPYEIGRLAQDLAGGLMVTLPSQKELEHPEVGEIMRKYLKGRAEIATEDRIRVLRLIENMTLGRNAVGYLTESMHGAGSPQAQRVQIARAMQVEFKKQLAKSLAGIARGLPRARVQARRPARLAAPGA